MTTSSNFILGVLIDWSPEVDIAIDEGDCTSFVSLSLSLSDWR